MSYFFSLTLKMNFPLSPSEGGAYPSTQDAEAGQSLIPDQLNYTVRPGVTVKLYLPISRSWIHPIVCPSVGVFFYFQIVINYFYLLTF